MHLPAPHVWQVVPAGQPRSVDVQMTIDAVGTQTRSNGHARSHSGDPPKYAPSIVQTTMTSPALIVTLSLHVRTSLPDADILGVTQWASSRVLSAFGRGDASRGCGCTDVEVTVGVVRV